MNLYGGRRPQQINDVEVPDGGWPGAGRPPEHRSTYGTDKSPFGRDPLGRKDIGKSLDVNLSPKHKYKGGSPLATESTVNKKDSLPKEISTMLQNMSGVKVKTKQIISESLKSSAEQQIESSNLLDESNLFDEI